MAGYHEVMYSDTTKVVLDRKIKENEEGANHILWRISSTLFSHLRYNVDLTPLSELSHLHNEFNMQQGKYKPMTAHDKLMEELRCINLAPKITIKSEAEMQAQEEVTI